MELPLSSAGLNRGIKRTHLDMEQTPIELPLAAKIHLLAGRHMSSLSNLYTDLCDSGRLTF